MNNPLWKPDPQTVVSLNKWKKTKSREKKPKNQKGQNSTKAREDLLRHFKMHKYSSNMAICLCIHNETGISIPETERATKKLIMDYWKNLRGSPFHKYRFMSDDKFYSSQKWKELRYIALKQTDGTCMLCGARASDGVQIHVDHIKSRSKYPELQFDLNNLQVLCDDCNFGKSNFDETDWRY